MEQFRRRPPMEGFSQPGSLGGGEAWDDDSVEGHIMDDLRQDQDVEGHRFERRADDDTEGHVKFPRADGDDDTEGHVKLPRADGDDDTEGHIGGLSRRGTEDDDTEGHAAKIR